MKRGLTLIEILIALLFLSGAVLSLFGLNRISNQGAMDAYFETLSLQLAREPLEIFKSFGYRWVEKLRTGEIPPPIQDLKIGDWIPVSQQISPGGTAIFRPVDGDLFRRRISLSPFSLPGQPAAILIEVEVVPVEESNAMRWLTRPGIKLADLVVEDRQ